LPEGRIKNGGDLGGPKVENEFLFKIIDVLDEVSKAVGKTVPQVALNWRVSIILNYLKK
jgi:aryl-alcohol dehydrogenase-like predicted oxidoreductase